MMLTEAGKHLLPYAAEMVELYEKRGTFRKTTRSRRET